MGWDSLQVATIRDKDFLYNEIILNDQYRLSKLQGVEFDYIIDIGANVGYFSLLSNKVAKNATIIALEPIPETFDRLKTNTAGTGIRALQAAIGDGRDLFIKRATNGEPVCDQCVAHPTDQEPINTLTFYRLFKKLKIPFDSKYMIKFDCEGGEASFLHKENFNVIKNATYITGEVHFDSVGTKEYPSKEEVLMLIRELDQIFSLDISLSDHFGHLYGFKKNKVSVDHSWLKQMENKVPTAKGNNDNICPFEKVDTVSVTQKGIELLNNGYTKEAKECFFEVLIRDRNNIENLFNLGTVYYKERNTFEAIEYLLKILRMDAYHKKALLLLCRILESEGRLEIAIPMVEKNLKNKNDEELRKYYEKSVKKSWNNSFQD